MTLLGRWGLGIPIMSAQNIVIRPSASYDHAEGTGIPLPDLRYFPGSSLPRMSDSYGFLNVHDLPREVISIFDHVLRTLPLLRVVKVRPPAGIDLVKAAKLTSIAESLRVDAPVITLGTRDSATTRRKTSVVNLLTDMRLWSYTMSTLHSSKQTGGNDHACPA